MHTLKIIAGGVVLLAVFLLLGWLFGGNSSSLAAAAKLFIPAWFAVSVVNLWVGVSRAGYTVREELPILLVVFIVPAAVAAIAIWRWHS